MAYSPPYLAALFYSSFLVRDSTLPQYHRPFRLNQLGDLGIKPLSIYGLVHFFRPGRGSLVDANYLLSPEERDRIVGTLREHLLDVDDVEGDGVSSSHYNAINVLPLSDRPHHNWGSLL